MIHACRKEPLSHLSSPKGLLRRYAALPGCILLETHPSSVGISYLFLEPVANLIIQNGTAYIKTPEGVDSLRPSPLGGLSSFLNPIYQDKTPAVPCVAGYFAYEFLHYLENIPRVPYDALTIPDAVFFLFRKVITFDQGKANLYEFEFKKWNTSFWECSSESLEAREPEIHFPIERLSDSFLQSFADTYSSFKSKQYEEAVRIIKGQIRDGEVYQVNLSRQFQWPMALKATDFYEALSALDAAEYASFLSLERTGGEPFYIASASPELFFETRNNLIRCLPIKGTRPRKFGPADDLASSLELRNSEKDHAELAMIVDLVRNDVGRISETNSVRVTKHAELVSHAQVHHLVSTIEGSVRREVGLSDIISALFPCGSVTGAPKIAAMKCIAEMEQRTRGVYTGAIGYVGSCGVSTFSVPIRTALVNESDLIFSAGGGVVIDSSPEFEADETLHKSRGIVSALQAVK